MVILNKIGLKQRGMALVGGLACLLAGCEFEFGSTLTQDCDSLRDDIVELSERDRAARGYAIIKIYEPTEVSKSDTELVCTGQANWSDGDETGLTYRFYVDSDGDAFIEYEVTE
ncbi:MAG: hypothetical protein VKI82_10820 [Leptolyngbya sp.]|nr:hypothetical protein [Leptolyngbya sp.]